MYLGRIQQSLLAIFLSLGLASCMVGPDFKPPESPKTSSYTEKPVSKKTVSASADKLAGKAQYFAAGQDVPAQWWYLYHCPELDMLVRRGLDNSPTLAAAKATLKQAQENLRAQIGESMYPAVDAQVIVNREKFSNTAFGIDTPATIFTLYNPQFNISYTLDMFGGLRRQIEALRAQVDYQQYELEAAYLTLTSNIVTTAINMASAQAQIRATHELIRAQQDQLMIVRKQLHLGGASQSDVLTQESQLAQTRATLPPLEQNLAQYRHALAVLVGELPSEAYIPYLELSKLNLPSRLPISIPSLLVRQRPDIRAQEALLHAATAQVGVATANLYPQITLTGFYGWENNTLSQLFDNTNNIWNIQGELLQPIFRGGALRASRRAAIAGYEQSAAQYRQTVLQAFQNVADTLRALENDAKTLQAQKQAEIAARDSLKIISEQYRLGGVSYLSLLTAQKQYQQAKIALIQAQAARFRDTAALFQALGGGWWNRPSTLVMDDKK